MTTVKTFDSTMSGAPVLSGTAGALINVVKTCLVDGFGASAVQALSVTGGVATATYATSHPFRVGSVALIAGATPAALNGQKRVLSITSTTITFDATGVADGSATGSITSQLASAGWSQAFSGTNLSALKPSVVEATGCVLRIDDAGTTNARVRAFESMSDINTGLGPTPMDSQVNGGLWWPKSNAASSAARPWVLVADARGFYLGVDVQGTGRFTLLFAGDIASLKSGDAYGYLITGNQADQTTISTVPDGCCGWSHRSARGGAYGTTKAKGSPNTPRKSRVRLLRERDGLLAREVWSDQLTGAFEFTGVDAGTRWVLLAQDASSAFWPAAASSFDVELLP